jgi:succinyl-CoA synthetase beta subunit
MIMLYTQKKYDMRDVREENPIEVEAKEVGLNYDLDGTVGCMVNGAGLAMATMDLTSMLVLSLLTP